MVAIFIMAIGRRTDLTPELQERICKLISDNGMYPAQAALVCGISERTFYEWLARGRVVDNSSNGNREPGTRGLGDTNGVYGQFAQAIKKADAKLELSLVTDALGKARKSKNPLAPVILLSRRFRERWSEQIQVASAGKEAVVSMERIKEAWDAPEIVEGEYAVLETGAAPKLEVGKVVADSSQKCSLTNLDTNEPTEADDPVASFHALPADFDDPEYIENDVLENENIEPNANHTQLRRLINERREAIEDTDTDQAKTPDNIDRPAADARQPAENERQLDEGLPPFTKDIPTTPTPVEISEVKSRRRR